MSRALVTVPLDIPDVRIVRTEMNENNELIITIESVKQGVACRCCGQWIEKFHGHDDWITVRHLPVFGRPTYLRHRPKRYQCLTCTERPTTTERVAWHESNSPHTVAFDTHLLLQLVNATVEDVSHKEQVTYDRVLGALERRIRPQVDWSAYQALGLVGLDEIALKKGHRDFVVIVTARLADGRLVLLGVLPDRTKDTVVAFLRTIPARLQRTIQTVCCDMYDAYTEAVREELKSARLVIDRFHVAEHYHAAADTLRKQELKRLKQTLSEADSKALKGSMWAFRKKLTDLKPEERESLDRLFGYAPRLEQAHQLREQLTAIFDEHISKSVAKIKIQAWIKRVKNSDLKCFDEFLKTLANWWEDITNYFVNRDNSGFVEGLNNKLKVLKRRCYGLFNVTHLFQRIYLDLEGYRLFAD
jgi:transposase